MARTWNIFSCFPNNMLMRFFLLITLTLITTFSFSIDFKGQWKGMISINADFSDEQVIYINLDAGNLLARTEITDTDVYALKRIKLKDSDNNKLILEEINFKSRASSRQTPSCKLEFDLLYNDSTGYLRGSFKSTDCRNYMGYVILFQDDFDFPSEKANTISHLWLHRFKTDLEKGFLAPLIRQKELANFKFEPIYFDHDKSLIKPEYKKYLLNMIRVVQGHSDIRIQVTGHTDAVGTDSYNVALSERRAKSIRDFFVANGLPEDKLNIDFKGEKQPVDTNKTSAGKQRNRRVDFKFI